MRPLHVEIWNGTAMHYTAVTFQISIHEDLECDHNTYMEIQNVTYTKTYSHLFASFYGCSLHSHQLADGSKGDRLP